VVVSPTAPHPHSATLTPLPKKVRAMAMKHALSSKVKDEALIVLDGFDGEKTKDLVAQLKALGIENALFIGGAEVNEKFAKAAATSRTSTCSRSPASTSTTFCAARRWCCRVKRSKA
jgi:ribosomal protein L4